jgi:hypothetical protein
MLCVVAVAAAAAGCGGGSGSAKSEVPSYQPPRAVVKRVPCKLKFGPLAAALEVDLSEVRNLALDAKQLYNEIVNGEPSSAPPPAESPVVMVVNKKGNKFTYFTLTPNVKELRLRTANSSEVELIVKNQEPLRVELWVNTDQPIDIDIEFKDATVLQPKS